ncbi:MAG TPA: PepSY-associated TM helix domain-containing protein, partial [Iamia sp.]|nr:PepSY-associated TM helix domain-containing protein [Iamia sp.]
MTTTEVPPPAVPDDEVVEGPTLTHAADIERRIGRGKRLSKRIRRLIVLLHRWVSFALLAWVVVISLTGAWLVFGPAFDSWLHRDRFATTSGDVGPAAALAAVTDDELPQAGEGAYVYSTVLPRNGRGVYQVNVAVPLDAEGLEERYLTYFVDPGGGGVNGVQDEEEGFSHWMLRGHEALWQDHGVLNVFHPDDGWCRPDGDGAEPGGPKGVVCDVIPDGLDLIGWFAVGFFFILTSGFYLWYWPNVRRWATALVIKRGRGRFQFHLSLH